MQRRHGAAAFVDARASPRDNVWNEPRVGFPDSHGGVAGWIVVRWIAAGGRRARPTRPFPGHLQEKDLGEFTLHVPGVHNVLNATAAIAVGTALDIPAEQIRSALDGFRGVDRRFS